MRCLHCYSSSGPEVDESLPVALLEGAIESAAVLGYRAMAVSGGEPLLYRPLPGLLDAARANGLLTTLTTNGMTVTRRRAAMLAGRVDLVAVSVDGPPARHDRMRARDGAFAGMLRGLTHLRDAGVPLGFIFTLTQHNVADLPWLAEFAAQQGAVLLQAHPLDLQGRALVTEVAAARPDAFELAVARAVRVALERAAQGLTVEVDAVERGDAAGAPARFLGTGQVGSWRLGEWVQPLVVKADGTVLPLTYDFPAEFGLGSLHDGDLVSLAREWIDTGRAESFAATCQRAFQTLTGPDGPPISYWYESLTATVRRELAQRAMVG